MITHPRNVNAEHRDSLSLADRIAATITRIVGTMWFFSACVVLTLLPLVWPAAMPYVQFISSAFLQLVLLPLLQSGQNISARHGELRAEAHYQHEQVNQMHVDLILRELRDLRVEMARLQK